MTANTASAFRRAGKKTLIPALLFALSIVLTVFVTWQTAQSCLDGDASSELVLAQHLNETGRILSSDWYYSTELRVLNTQLVFAPLFSLFSDWTMVRFTGALILQATLVLSFFYLCRQAKLSWGARFLGGALLLLPVSVGYGRIVLYHNYYMPHITISFLITALFMSVIRCRKAGHRSACIRLFALCALSFGSGLGGVRQGMITHIPILLLLFVLFFQESMKRPLFASLKDHWRGIAVSLCAFFAFLTGYAVNARFLSSRFFFRSYNDLTLRLIDPGKLSDVLFGCLHAFGFRQDIPVLSISGILSLTAVFSFSFCVVRGALLLSDDQHSPAHRFLGLLFPCAMLVMLSVFLLIDSAWHYLLYFLPVTVWSVVLLAMLYDQMPSQAIQFKTTHVLALLTAICLTANGLVNAAFFASTGKLFSQPYTGVGSSDILLAGKLEKPVEFLLENDYELGYAEFWYANTVTEISDGAISAINLIFNHYNRPLVIHEWLMLESTLKMQTDKVFLLLSHQDDRLYQLVPMDEKGEKVYDDGEFVIYHFDDPSPIRDYTGW